MGGTLYSPSVHNMVAAVVTAWALPAGAAVQQVAEGSAAARVVAKVAVRAAVRAPAVAGLGNRPAS